MRTRIRAAVIAFMAVASVAFVALVVFLLTDGPRPFGPDAPSGAVANASASPDRPAVKDLYIDCTAKGDGDGSSDRPWTSPSSLESASLAAGATVQLKRGCSWDGAVKIGGAGTSAQPIVVSAFGDGPAPILTAGSNPKTVAVLTVDAPFTQVSGLHIKNAAGPGITLAGADSAVADTEIESVAIGVQMRGDRTTASRMTVHDLRMLTNTPGGNDDAGAIGFAVEASDVTITDSSCVNCVAPSYDYGTDGGFADIWNHGDRLTISNCTATNVDGFLEVGGDLKDASAVDVKLAGNTVKSVGGFLWLHTTGDYAMAIGRLEASGNTIVNDSTTEVLGGSIGTVEFVDNTVTSSSQVAYKAAPGVHRDNTYTLPATVSVGFPVQASERPAGP